MTDLAVQAAGNPAQVATMVRSRQERTCRLVTRYVDRQSAAYFDVPDTAVLGATLLDFVASGKYIRSTFAYLGWLCGRDDDEGAAQAAASLELLHAFALIQDDVMDDSAVRRGAPSVHVRLADWAGHKVASPAGFGRSAAILLSDLCLIWAERMLREADLPSQALARAWPVYDLMRAELAVGQYSDLLNEHATSPSLAQVLDIARRKSGNYTVRRPLELGAALAGCPAPTVRALQEYGKAIGEAFQLRDDLLGVFGDPSVTGKPVGDDLRQRKATSVIVAARDLADRGQSLELRRLAASGPEDEEAWVRQWQDLIRGCGAEDWAERAIARRVDRALTALDNGVIGAGPARDALELLAGRCTDRAA